MIYSVWQNSKIELKNKILLFRPHIAVNSCIISFPELRSFWSASGIDLRRWPKLSRLWEREWALGSCQKQLERCLAWRHSWILGNYWILAEYDLKNYGDRGPRRIIPFKISTCNKYPTNNIFLRWCYSGRYAMTIFRCCNIVSNGCIIFLSKYCITVLR